MVVATLHSGGGRKNSVHWVGVDFVIIVKPVTHHPVYIVNEAARARFAIDITNDVPARKARSANAGPGSVVQLHVAVRPPGVQPGALEQMKPVVARDQFVDRAAEVAGDGHLGHGGIGNRGVSAHPVRVGPPAVDLVVRRRAGDVVRQNDPVEHHVEGVEDLDGRGAVRRGPVAELALVVGPPTPDVAGAHHRTVVGVAGARGDDRLVSG